MGEEEHGEEEEQQGEERRSWRIVVIEQFIKWKGKLWIWQDQLKRLRKVWHLSKRQS